MKKEEIKFNTENDLNIAIIKDGKELLINEDCCTCINIMLKNDGQILTSFLGSHNPYIVSQLEQAQKYYFKSLKKALKAQSLDVEYGCGCGCEHEHEHDCCDHDCDCHSENGDHDCGCHGEKHSEKCDCNKDKSKCTCEGECKCTPENHCGCLENDKQECNCKDKKQTKTKTKKQCNKKK